jgi:ribonucleotide monophosphatase NagD (HAD superfamily)
MIGDTIEMDILGANKTGIHSALVLTGNTARLLSGAKNVDTRMEILEKMYNIHNARPNIFIDLG